MKLIVNCLTKNWANFRQRASRKEYWLFYLTFMLTLFAVSLIGTYLLDKFVVGIIAIVFLVLFIIPMFAVTVRRLHDTGKSGWVILISWIPVIGAILMLIFLCQKGKQEENKYGLNPLVK